ncbi:MBL fold metallo-hydrolase [Pseudoalteromonas piscicida]|uniref:MBL fold metallo-hydrolase n=1 Tax=Pseudoalteromonas piscicida TaxID=43662 RepID=UPI0030B40FA1
MRHRLTVALIWLVVASSAYSSEMEVLYQTEKAMVVRDKDYGPNIGVLASKAGLILIDPTTEEARLPNLNGLLARHFQAKRKYLLNTHKHSDHTGGNEFFQQQGFVLIDTFERLEELGVIEYSEAVSHTAHDRVFFHPASNILFTGDVYTSNWHPTFYAGGLTGFNKAIDMLLSFGDKDTLIVPGHGKPTTKRELEQHRVDTIAWVERVKQLAQKGMTVEQIKQDSRIQALLSQFNLEQRKPFLPQRALTRFVERTLTVITHAEEG